MPAAFRCPPAAADAAFRRAFCAADAFSFRRVRCPLMLTPLAMPLPLRPPRYDALFSILLIFSPAPARRPPPPRQPPLRRQRLRHYAPRNAAAIRRAAPRRAATLRRCRAAMTYMRAARDLMRTRRDAVRFRCAADAAARHADAFARCCLLIRLPAAIDVCLPPRLPPAMFAP